MQIHCKKFGCQKAVQVCYWSCKFRKNCKDWLGALDETPGKEAMRSHLEAASQKSGRPFDAETMIFKKAKARATALTLTPSTVELAVVQAQSLQPNRPTGRARVRKA